MVAVAAGVGGVRDVSISRLAVVRLDTIDCFERLQVTAGAWAMELKLELAVASGSPAADHLSLVLFESTIDYCLDCRYYYRMQSDIIENRYAERIALFCCCCC